MNTYFYNKELDEIRSKLSLSEIEKINETLQKYSFILNSNDSLENTKRMFALYLTRKRQIQKWGISILLLLFFIVSFFVLFYNYKGGLKDEDYWLSALEFLLYASTITIIIIVIAHFFFFRDVKRFDSILRVEKLFKNHFVEFENFKKNFQAEINNLVLITNGEIKTEPLVKIVRDKIILEPEKQEDRWNSNDKQTKIDDQIIEQCNTILSNNKISSVKDSLEKIKKLLGIS